MLSGRSGHSALAAAPGRAGEPSRVYPSVISFALSKGGEPVEGCSAGPSRAYPLPVCNRWTVSGDLDVTSSYFVQSRDLECLSVADENDLKLNYICSNPWDKRTQVAHHCQHLTLVSVA